MSNRVLVVAAHPDDEVLGCGGALLKHSAAGDEIHIMILGEGVTARFDDRKAVDSKHFKVLYSESKSVAKYLKSKSHSILGFPDNAFDTVAILDIIKAIEKKKEEVIPDVVYTHYSGDLNIDHQLTHKSVMTAFRPLPEECVKKIYCFETPSSTEYSNSSFSPNVFYDIEDYIESKIYMLEMYKSEMRYYPHSRSSEYAKSLAAVRGMSVGMKYAEAFMLAREVCE